MCEQVRLQAEYAIKSIESRLAELGLGIEAELESVGHESADTIYSLETGDPVEALSPEMMYLGVQWHWFTLFLSCEPEETVIDLFLGMQSHHWASIADALGVAWPPCFDIEVDWTREGPTPTH